MAQHDISLSDRLWQALYQAMHSHFTKVSCTSDSVQHSRDPSHAPFPHGKVGTVALVNYLFHHIVGHETFRAADTVLVLTDTRPLEEMTHWPYVSRILR